MCLARDMMRTMCYSLLLALLSGVSSAAELKEGQVVKLEDDVVVRFRIFEGMELLEFYHDVKAKGSRIATVTRHGMGVSMDQYPQSAYMVSMSYNRINERLDVGICRELGGGKFKRWSIRKTEKSGYDLTEE